MKVYWSRCGYGHGNFGDKVTPLLLRHAGIYCEWSPPERAELIGVGSILEKVEEDFSGIIWSTGLMSEHSRKHFPRATVLALRGRMTQARVTPVSGPMVLGDAGLLCHLFRRPSVKRYKLGIIPHFVDVDDAIVRDVARSSDEITVIDICGPTLDVITEVDECDHVISSSLHGLILADSLGIPNRWIELNRGSEKVSGRGFKFRDYYSVYDIPSPTPETLRSDDNLDSILSRLGGYSRPGLEEIKRELLKSLTEIAERQPAPDSEVAVRKVLQQEAWSARLRQTSDLIQQTLPASATVILADDDQLKGRLSFSNIRSFMDRDGEYWGLPSASDEAIAELERLRSSGAEYLVVPFNNFWLFDAFAEFADHLIESSTCVMQNDDAVVYRL